MKKQPLFLFLFFISLIGLFFYSFTQVDLSLTLSRASFVADIQKSFQYVGYFNRPLSTYLFAALLVMFFATYIYGMRLLQQKKLVAKDVLKLSGISLVMLLFSYNAFSYDVFNYIFDAKIVTYYQENPYEHKALDYPGDPMLSFMRWTHRTYPYGPVWLGVTVPISFIGFQYFVPTFFLFKLLMAVSYFGTVYFIGQILKTVKPQLQSLGMMFFALNPLVLVETIVSAHNDIVMLFLAVLSLHLLVKQKYVRSSVLLMLSIGIKFATVLLAPVFAGLYYMQVKKKHIQWDYWFGAMCVLMLCAIILATYRTNYQPWYLLYFLTFAAFLSDKSYVRVPSIILSLASLINYLPFLYLGNWDPPVPFINSMLIYGSVFLSFLFVAIYKVVKR